MIRINELARELEVKPKTILDLLPDLGVSEKKTHSSSIEADVAQVIKQKLLAEAALAGPKRQRRAQSADPSIAEGRAEEPGPSEPQSGVVAHESHPVPPPQAKPAPEIAPQTAVAQSTTPAAEAPKATGLCNVVFPIGGWD